MAPAGVDTRMVPVGSDTLWIGAKDSHLVGVDEDAVPEQRVPQGSLELKPAFLVDAAGTWVESEDLGLELGLTYEPRRPADAESVVSIVRITGGNFRLVERLMSQVARIMTINNLDTITPDAIEAAREVLVVGV